ncbi:TOMM precursor leader peptide-binding protein [Arthrobacter sp. Y-9]|uniref:TOMM precursor leader peptide-binding protein n=1 Tax=Arthrobacter sp. Y-9 TaxID=3039385 RepID=UPI00241CD33D|nr:TOMM precursor leader peptide-binding protein [Arthrobacter sp. Y-9]WFR83672.1 TOMM precursor leader peptide-binding protein [Arthrobacter sp. Y-9]
MNRPVQLKPYLPVRRSGTTLSIGNGPPRAIDIEDAPGELEVLIELLSRPTDTDSVAEAMAGRAEVDAEGWREVIAQLSEAGVVGDPIPDSSRYARHLLYFDMLGLPAEEAQNRVRAAKVAVVGVGGIGSNVATLLATAGVGEILLTDGDEIELSNLTRQFLYDESVIGELKVDAATRRLQMLNSEVTVRSIATPATRELFHEQLADYDVVVVSADSPDELHRWADEGSRKHGFAYLSAGYIEAFGAVGPTVLPGLSACFTCMLMQGEPANDERSAARQGRNLNLGHQAASYGPLNLLVAALAANEVIRLVTGAVVSSTGNRLLLDSQSYSLTTESFVKLEDCPECGMTQPREEWRSAVERTSLEDLYEASRSEDSINAVVLDSFLLGLALSDGPLTALDFGCGSGEQAIALAQRGLTVTAFDPSAGMIDIVRSRIESQPELRVTAGAELDALVGNSTFDLVMCSNVLDHVGPEQFDATVERLRSLTVNTGRAIITVPHPIKDGASWIRTGSKDHWEYKEVRLKEYFNEGPITKHRENANGEMALRSIRTYHRTIENYATAFLRHGFNIVSITEPRPPASAEHEFPEIWAKTTRVPYFMTFVLRPAD